MGAGRREYDGIEPPGQYRPPLGRNIEIYDGLNPGDEIVAVGAAYLAEGMKVSRMKLTEQAVPRADDPS